MHLQNGEGHVQRDDDHDADGEKARGRHLEKNDDEKNDDDEMIVGVGAVGWPTAHLVARGDAS